MATNDEFIQILVEDDRFFTFINQIRFAMSSMNDYNKGDVTIRVNSLLARLDFDDKPETFQELLTRLHKAYPGLSPTLQKTDREGYLAHRMRGSLSLDASAAPIQALAWGSGTGYGPQPENIFFAPETQFPDALKRISRLFSRALAEATNWRRMEVDSLRTYMRKTKNSNDNIVVQLASDINHARQLFQHGREGWKLIKIPHNFYDDVLPLIDQFTDIVQHVSIQHPDLRALAPKFLDPAMRIFNILQQLKQMRIEEEKKAEEAKERDLKEKALWKQRQDDLQDDMHPEIKENEETALRMMGRANLDANYEGDVFMDE